MGLVFKQKHTQWPGPGRTNDNVVGERMFPRYAVKQGGFFMIVFGVDRADGRPVPDQPDLAVRPVRGVRVVSAASQPDWYVMFLDGSTRLMPAWEIHIPIGDGYSHPAAVLADGRAARHPDHGCRCSTRSSRPGALKDTQIHNLLQRPRDVPARTALGAMAVAFYIVLTLSGGNDVIADKFHISLNAMTWAGRIGLLIVPAAGVLRRRTGSAWACSSTTGRCWRTAWRPASSGACRTAGSSRSTSRSRGRRPRTATARWSTPAGSCRRR